MAAASYVIYVAVVAIETNKTKHSIDILKVQRTLIICGKYHVNWVNGDKSRGEGPIDSPLPPLMPSRVKVSIPV